MRCTRWSRRRSATRYNSAFSRPSTRIASWLRSARSAWTGLLTLLAGPTPGTAAALLGLTPGNITALKLLLEDMLDDVATQLCNSFAQDRADETDDRLWETPGDGLAVSPDDIKEFWDPPESPTDHAWHGLYGISQKMLLTTGRFEPRLLHRLDRSKGPAYVVGAGDVPR